MTDVCLSVLAPLLDEVAADSRYPRFCVLLEPDHSEFSSRLLNHLESRRQPRAWARVRRYISAYQEGLA